MMPTPPSIDELRFVFVVTFGRSGSTILNNVLNAIPGYQIRGENHGALFHLWQAGRAVRTTHDRYGPGELRKGVESPFYGASRLSPDLWEDVLAAGFVANVLRPSAETRVAGFKEIRHTPNFMTDDQFRGYMDHLLAVFPGARIVFNTRKVEEVVRSGWWADMPADKVTRLINRTAARFEEYHAAAPKRTILMRYNDYAGAPEAMRPLFRFLGEPFDLSTVAEVMKRPVSKPREAMRERLVDLT